MMMMVMLRMWMLETTKGKDSHPPLPAPSPLFLPDTDKTLFFPCLRAQNGGCAVHSTWPNLLVY